MNKSNNFSGQPIIKQLLKLLPPSIVGQAVKKHTSDRNTIKNAISGVSQIAHKKGVVIEFKNNEIFNAHYDEDRINQVLTNLLTNSIKSVDKDKGAVKILFNQTENNLVFSIEDNGKGVPEGEENYIFDKFYQSKNQNIKKPLGSGLGLTICKKIVEGHQGKIWVDTKYDQGARFLFTIPHK